MSAKEGATPPDADRPHGWGGQKELIEQPANYAEAGLWGIGTLASAVSIYRLAKDYLQFGAGPIVDAFLTWWASYVHPPLDCIYSLLPFELLQLAPPTWLRDFHVLSIVGASLFIRGTRFAKGDDPRSWFGMAGVWLWNLAKVAVYGLSGFGAIYLFSGIALLLRPHRYGLWYRSLVLKTSHPLLGLFRATALSVFGVLLLFALSYAPAPG